MCDERAVNVRKRRDCQKNAARFPFQPNRVTGVRGALNLITPRRMACARTTHAARRSVGLGTATCIVTFSRCRQELPRSSDPGQLVCSAGESDTTWVARDFFRFLLVRSAEVIAINCTRSIRTARNATLMRDGDCMFENELLIITACFLREQV